MSALILLVNANVDTSQRVSILAVASPSSDIFDYTDSIDKMLTLVHYDAVATVMRQCNDQRSYGTNANIISHSARLPPHHRSNRADRYTQRKRMTRD